MREILFKAKRFDTGEWCYGVPLVEGWSKTTYIASYEYSSLAFVQQIEVVPETLCQFTGLHDKNGKRIFEGDIISTDIKRPYLIVEFRDGCFMFNCNDGGEDYYDIMLPICKEAHTEYEHGEIIGNIHDNPELLTAERK